jgi:hypothetical protein
MNLGQHAWDDPTQLSSNIIGGEIRDNTIANARLGVNIDGVSGLRFYRNAISGSPISAEFLCGQKPTGNLNVNTADSSVDFVFTPPPFTKYSWHNCP